MGLTKRYDWDEDVPVTAESRIFVDDENLLAMVRSTMWHADLEKDGPMEHERFTAHQALTSIRDLVRTYDESGATDLTHILDSVEVLPD